MAEQRDWEDSNNEKWTSICEQQILDELDGEPNLDDRLPEEKQFATEKLWYRFQNCAGAVTQLYKERLHDGSVPLWLVFQNAATNVTKMYKDSVDAHKRSLEFGVQMGQQRRTKEIAAWAKKHRRFIRREDLLAFLCGKSPPQRPRQNQAPRGSPDRSSPRLHSPPRERMSNLEPVDELQPFRDALALHGLNGAMANVGVSQSPPHGRRRHPSSVDLEDILTSTQDTRKRNSNESLSSSPSHKRSRFI